MGNMSDWISRILATALFILSYYTAYLGVRELYLGRVWTDRALILFVVLTVCSLSIEVSTMIAHAVIRVRELCPRSDEGDDDDVSHPLLLKNTPRLRRGSSTIPFDPSFTPVQQL